MCRGKDEREMSGVLQRCVRGDRCPRCLKLDYKRAVAEYQKMRREVLVGRASTWRDQQGNPYQQVITSPRMIQKLLDARVEVGRLYRRWKSKVATRRAEESAVKAAKAAIQAAKGAVSRVLASQGISTPVQVPQPGAAAEGALLPEASSSLEGLSAIAMACPMSSACSRQGEVCTHRGEHPEYGEACLVLCSHVGGGDCRCEPVPRCLRCILLVAKLDEDSGVVRYGCKRALRSPCPNV